MHRTIVILATILLVSPCQAMMHGIVVGGSASSTELSDNFTRDDGPDSINWVRIAGTENELQIISHTASGLGQQVDDTYIFHSSPSSQDQYSQVTLAGLPGKLARGPVVRGSGSGAYALGVVNDTGDYSGKLQLYVYDNSAWTLLQTLSATETFVNGDVYKLAVHGDNPPTLIVYKNDSMEYLPYQDLVHNISGLGAGFFVANNDVSQSSRIDNWRAGNFAYVASPQSDLFERDSLGPMWFNKTPDFTLALLNGNVVTGPSAEDTGNAYWQVDQFGEDQFSEITLGNIATGDWIGAGVRMSQATSYPRYVAVVYSGSIIIFYRAPGQWISLATASATYTAGDLLRLEVSGENPVHLVAKINGETITSFDDSTYKLLGGNPGLEIYDSAKAQVTTITAWQGGNL